MAKCNLKTETTVTLEMSGRTAEWLRAVLDRVSGIPELAVLRELLRESDIPNRMSKTGEWDKMDGAIAYQQDVGF